MINSPQSNHCVPLSWVELWEVDSSCLIWFAKVRYPYSLFLIVCVFSLMQVELEKLNTATDDINKLESKLEVSFWDTEKKEGTGICLPLFLLS